jgi:hypothetical protein
VTDALYAGAVEDCCAAGSGADGIEAAEELDIAVSVVCASVILEMLNKRKAILYISTHAPLPVNLCR